MEPVLYDANVLYPSTLRDVLIRVGLARLVQPRWTDQILDEVFRNLADHRPDLSRIRLSRTRRLMQTALPEAAVTGHEEYIGRITLPDPDDRHVLAAAIHTGASTIVTKNLRDFPPAALKPWRVEARHPDTFLSALHARDRDPLVAAVLSIARTWSPENPRPQDVLERLAVDAPGTARLIDGALPAALR